MFLKIKAFFMALVIALGSVSMIFRPAVPEAKSVDELQAEGKIINSVELADKLYVVDQGNIPEEQLHSVICLQGLVNRDKAQLYFINSDTYRNYLNEIRKEGKEVVTTDSNGKEWTLELLIKEFKSYITDSGYVLYRNSEFAEGLNTACNYATVEGWLAIPEEIKDIADSCGLTLKKDISKETYNYKFLKKFFNEYKDCFRKDAIVHVKTEKNGLRDLAIQQRFFITYSESNTSGQNYLKKILKWTGGNSYILGWGETEKHFVKFCSEYGCAVIPADHSYDNSVLASYKCSVPEQTGNGEKIVADKSKHYVAIVFSDGDNSQWVQNGYAEYYEKLKSYDSFPMTWTYPLIQQEISPVCSKLAYDCAGKNNCFIAGVSGSGYMNPSYFDVDCLDQYTTDTAAMMLRSNIDVVTILDDKADLIDTKKFEQNFDYFSRFDNVKGGILMIDPDKYASCNGKVWFTNDKPFISVRLSLWYSGDENRDIPLEWVREQAETLNSFEADPSTINGYTVVNVHPWSISIENLAYFVSCLDEHIELVTADQLVDLVSENVEHKTAETTQN